MHRINNVRLPCPIGDLEEETLWQLSLDEEEVITSLTRMDLALEGSEDTWGGDWLSPRGIDLQINGGLGVSFSELSLQDLPKLLELLDYLWRDGVRAICPTIVTSSISSVL